MTFPIYGKKTSSHVPNHQPVIELWAMAANSICGLVGIFKDRLNHLKKTTRAQLGKAMDPGFWLMKFRWFITFHNSV
jgi:hypothetical protein